MQSSYDPLAVTAPLAIVISLTFTLFLLFWALRYRKFSPNQYIIWLRNGKVRKARMGGAGIIMPLIDQIIIVPASLQKTSINFTDFEVTLHWRVTNPEVVYSRLNLTDTTIPQISEFLVESTTMIVSTNYGSTALHRIQEDIGQVADDLRNRLQEKFAQNGLKLEEVIINA